MQKAFHFCNHHPRIATADARFECLQIFGINGISVPDLLQALRKDGEVATIGTETGVLESKRHAELAAT